MTDLELLQRTPLPRPTALCHRFARKVDSILGFIAYGALWFFVSCLSATLALFLGIAIVGDQPSVVGKVLVAGMWITGFVGAWVLFALWVRRRVGPARRLFRDGTFTEAKVESVRHMSMRGAPFTHATLALGDRRIGLSMGGHPPELHEGAAIAVLVVPDYGYCATFPIHGKLIAASIK